MSLNGEISIIQWHFLLISFYVDIHIFTFLKTSLKKYEPFFNRNSHPTTLFPFSLHNFFFKLLENYNLDPLVLASNKLLSTLATSPFFFFLVVGYKFCLSFYSALFISYCWCSTCILNLNMPHKLSVKSNKYGEGFMVVFYFFIWYFRLR